MSIAQMQGLDQRIKAVLSDLIADGRKIFYLPAYQSQIKDEDVLGVVVARFLEWTPERILKAVSSALEDANLHELNAIVDTYAKQHELAQDEREGNVTLAHLDQDDKQGKTEPSKSEGDKSMTTAQQEKQPDLDLKALGGFIGTQQYYNVFGVNVTDGVKYIMDNGYSWLVTDSIAVIKCRADLKAQPFLVVKLKRTGDQEADMTIDDGNENILYTQHYDFTDAKRDVKLYFADNVLMLPTEY